MPGDSVRTVRFKLTSALGKAFELARAALKDLDADQVPARLRAVAGHPGDLTPDLARRLARELDQLEWLRLRALEAWPEADPEKPGPDRASALFLARPDGWAAALVLAVGEAASAARGEGRVQEGSDRDSVAADRDSWKAKARDALKKLSSAEAELARVEKSLRAPERALKAADAKAAAGRQKAAAAEAAALEALQGQVEAGQADVKKAREEIRRLRRALGDAEARAEEARTGPGWLGRDPVDLARHLDDLMTRARRATAPTVDESAAAETVVLPAGVAPDSPEAIAAVLQVGGPIAVIVDGYNAGLAFGKGTPAEVRERIETLLRRLRRLGSPAMTVTVIWDSAAEDSLSRRPGGLDVRFAPPGVPADDIVVEVAARSRQSVVITNDREVRERAERTGALALWSDALVAWARRRR